MLYYIVLNYIIISSLLNVTYILKILLTPTPTTHELYPRPTTISQTLIASLAVEPRHTTTR